MQEEQGLFETKVQLNFDFAKHNLGVESCEKASLCRWLLWQQSRNTVSYTHTHTHTHTHNHYWAGTAQGLLDNVRTDSVGNWVQSEGTLSLDPWSRNWNRYKHIGYSRSTPGINQHLWKGEDGGRSKLSVMEAQWWPQLHLWGTLDGATMVFQSCPKLGLHSQSLDVEPSSRSMTLSWASLCSWGSPLGT